MRRPEGSFPSKLSPSCCRSNRHAFLRLSHGNVTQSAHLDLPHLLIFPPGSTELQTPPHLPAPRRCRAEEVSLLGCPEKVPVPRRGGGDSCWLLPGPVITPLPQASPAPAGPTSPKGRLGLGCHPLPLRAVLLSPKHGFAFSPLPSATRARRDQVTVKPPLPASGPEHSLPSRYFPGLGEGLKGRQLLGLGKKE